MGTLISADTIQDRIDIIFGVGVVILDKSTYKNTHTKARFIDSIHGDWWVTPLSVLRGHRHPKEGHIKGGNLHKIPLNAIQEKLFTLFGDIVTIDSTTYVTASKKARFIDKDFGEWWAKPKGVLQGHGHWKRGILKKTLYKTSQGQTVRQWCAAYQIPYCTLQQAAQKNGLNFAIDCAVSNLQDGKYKVSKTVLENKFLDLMTPYFPNLSFFNKHITEIGPSIRPDFRLEHNGKVIYIDLHGLWWHGEHNKSKTYHSDRATEFRKVNIQFLQFFEDEIYEKPNIVKSIILSKLGLLTNKYHARKLEIREIPVEHAKLFFETNHLMGNKTSRYVGLYSDTELIAGLSYKIIVKTTSGFPYIEISRFATKLNTRCIGGFGKLVNYLKQFNKPIISFCDLRYADGHSYEALGFKNIGETLGWQWTDGVHRFNRLLCKAGKDKSEKENALERGWFKIYDAGQRKYKLDLF